MHRTTRGLLIFVALALIVYVTDFFGSSRDQWQSVEMPEVLQQDGKWGNSVLWLEKRKLIALIATGVDWSPSVSMRPTSGGWDVAVSGGTREAHARMSGSGPALLVAIPNVPPERFELSPASFDQLVTALQKANTWDPWAPPGSPSVVDVVRKNYAGPDGRRLEQLFSHYTITELSPQEREAVHRSLSNWKDPATSRSDE